MSGTDGQDADGQDTPELGSDETLVAWFGVLSTLME